jgi:hypothetical protein
VKWNDITDYQEIGKGVASVTTLDKRKTYLLVIGFLARLLKFFKKFLIVPIVLLILVDIIVSVILGLVTSLLVSGFGMIMNII